MAEKKNRLWKLSIFTKAITGIRWWCRCLYDITFNIAAGEFLALMGPSGSGKTTLLNLMRGIDQGDSGLHPHRRHRHYGPVRVGARRLASKFRGIYFSVYNLIPVLKAVENVELPLHLTTLAKNKRREHAEMALEMVGLGHRMDHYPAEMSGGEQQRVAIARAIVTDPTILVADEPTGDLDRVSAEEILSMMERLSTATWAKRSSWSRMTRAPQRAPRRCAIWTKGISTMLLLKILFRNAFHNKLRSGLTILGIAVAILAFGLLRTVISSFYAGVEAASASRLVTRNAISIIFALPISYAEKIRQVEGVKTVSWGNWFGGIYIDEKISFRTSASILRPILPCIRNSSSTTRPGRLFLFDRKGAVAGRKLAAKYRWKNRRHHHPRARSIRATGISCSGAFTGAARSDRR